MNVAVSPAYVAQDARTQHVTEAKILSFRLKAPGWHYGEGSGFDEETLSRAIILHRELIRWGLFTTDAFPGLRGQVVVTAYHSEHYFELSVEPDGMVSCLRECCGKVVVEKEGLTDKSAIQAIKDFAEQIWKQSGSSAFSSSTLVRADFRVVPLITRAEDSEASPSSTANASGNKVRPFANTSGAIMGKSRVSRQSSGVSRRTYFQMGAG